MSRETIDRGEIPGRVRLPVKGSTTVFLLARVRNGVWEVLHISWKLSRSASPTLMSMSYYKANVLHQPPVTKRVADSLSAVSGSDVPAEALMDLLCSLALNASSGETSADNLAFTARLLLVGTRKVYSLEREICMSKLPVVFTALKDILASEHEEAIFASKEALKSLISDCIDQRLIMQGVDAIRGSKKMDGRKSGPTTVIQKVCATVQSLLDYHHSAVWDMVFPVVGAMFDKLGAHSPYFARGTLENLADIQRLPDEDFPYRKQLHECLGSALAAMGPETFLDNLPLNLDSNDLSEVNVWLFPILKQYTVGARLSFFVETLLNSVSLLRNKSQKLELQGRIKAARSTDALVYSVWSLLPSFCNYPLDTAESFEDLKDALVKALDEQVEARGIICSALNVLIDQNKKILEKKSDPTAISTGEAPERALPQYTSKVAEDNLSVLNLSARELLLVLCRIFLESPADGGCLQSTISQFASIADKKDVERIFSKIMGRLLTAMKEALTTDKSAKSNSMRTDGQSNGISPLAERLRLFDLAVSLLPGLNGAAISVLFSAVKPSFEDNEGVLQKKAYKVLSIILQKLDEFLQSTLDELLQLMTDVMPLCHFSAKRYRLDCLYSLIVQVFKLQEDSEQRQQDIMGSFLTEIILALKEANKKTRNRAYDVLVHIGHACGDEENGGRRENLYNFFNLVAGGLAGETPHMVSAAVKGLAHLAYEFSDFVSMAYKLLPSTYLLLQRKNREVIKASLDLLEVLVAKSHTEELQIHLESMVDGLLKPQADSKNHFKAKVKYIIEMLVSKCGLDAVKAVMPEEHMKLLTNILKIKEQKERKQGAISEEIRSRLSRATISRLSQWNHTKTFSDFGEDTEDNDEFMDAKSAFGRSRVSLLGRSGAASSRRLHRSDRSLPEDPSDQMEDEPLDLLDRQKTRSALRSSGHLKRKQESDEEPEMDPEGRLIVYEGGKPKREKAYVPESDTKSYAGSHLSFKSTKKTKKQKTSDVGWAYTGSEYGSKKAGGDVKRKDKLEPYAYWPLDRKMISRRPKHQAAARKGMASVVKLTKKLEGRSASSALSMNLTRFEKQKKKGS